MYRYRAYVMKIYDGDTLTVRVDLGFNIFTEQKLRLARINAWEVRGTERPAGLIARDWLRSKILGKEVEVETTKTGKYGRYIAEVMLHGSNISDSLVANNHAKYQDY
jgi:micrococcal nuclease